MAVKQLDITRFRKVCALALSDPHDDSVHSQHERDAAWSLAEKMAQAAGLTWREALSKLDGAVPGYREHAFERALRHALRGHKVEGTALFYDELSPATLEAIKGAIPWPMNVPDAIAEEAVWNTIAAERESDGCGLEDGPAIRRHMLRDHLAYAEPPTAEEMVERAWWLASRGEREMVSDGEQHDALLTLARDIARMSNMLKAGRGAWGEPASQPKASRDTTRDKRERLRAVLSEPGAETLSTREVARRAGVSVQGAANFRKAWAGRSVQI